MSSKRTSRSSCSKLAKQSSAWTSRTSNTSGRRSSAYDADFEQHLIDNGVYPKGYEYPDGRQTPEPSNADEIRQRLAASRPSLSPSQFSKSDFRDFVRANDRVIDEGEVMRDVLPIVYGNVEISHKENLLFTRLESITNKVTVDTKPDFYDGAPTNSLDEQVRTDLGHFVVPTPHRVAPVVPNFFLEAKAPKGGADVAKRQIMHDLALGARGMHQLQSYATDKPVYDNNAYTLGGTYHAGTGTLQLYTSHITPTGPGGSLEYHTTQIDTWGLSGNLDTFRRGAAALRNGRDMMKEYRDRFISTANERARSAVESFPNDEPLHTLPHIDEEFQTSSGEPVTTSFYADTQPGVLDNDELAGNSVPYLNNAPKDFALSFSQPSTTSSAYAATSGDKLLYVQEGSETSTDELVKPLTISVPSKRPLKESGQKHSSKASRTLH